LQGLFVKPTVRELIEFRNKPIVACNGLIRQENPLYKRREIFYYIDMIFPLEELIEYRKNMYEITSAASRRAYQLSMLRDEAIEQNEGKVISLAARQLFTGQIGFRLE
jgi:DNA-directed RNA polymerase subunit omega